MRQVPQSRPANSYGRLVEKGPLESLRSRVVLGPALDLMMSGCRRERPHLVSFETCVGQKTPAFHSIISGLAGRVLPVDEITL